LLKSLTKLTHLSLADNHLERLPTLDERIRLEYLNLSYNRLMYMEDRWLPRQLQILDLKFNQIRSLEFLKNRLMNESLKQDEVSRKFDFEISWGQTEFVYPLVLRARNGFIYRYDELIVLV
jgi:hypothetical protein